MRLTKVEIRNYRSISHAKIDELGGMTTLIGANNEGKSNILKAIRLGLSVLADVQYYQLRRQSGSIRVRRDTDEIGYDWKTDFPVSRQTASEKDAATNIRFDFQLTPEETSDFQETFGIKINGLIPVSLSFGRAFLNIDIPKQGPGKKAFQDNESKIAKYVSRRLRFVYIPAIRTAETAHDIMSRIIERKVLEAEQPILDKVEGELEAARKAAFLEIEQQLHETFGNFVPGISSVRIRPVRSSRRRLDRSDYEVEVDDGSPTPLWQKGDGIQSLATMALMRSSSTTRDRGNTIYAIEEPEAHLHSEAVHKIRSVIDDRREDSQVIISSHSPIFVQRHRIASNIIVEKSRARKADSINEIRSCLGVRLPENLVSSSCVLLCEGATDVNFLRSYILEKHKDLGNYLSNGEISLIDMDGCGNLEYHCRLYIGLSCEVFAFLDNDPSSEQTIQNCVEKGLIKPKNIRKTANSARIASELEDLYPLHLLCKCIEDLEIQADEEFKNAKSQFTNRVKALAKKQGVVLAKGDLLKIKLYLDSLPFQQKTPDDIESIKSLDSICQKVQKFLVGG